MEKTKKEQNGQRDLSTCLEKYPEIQEAVEAMKRMRIVENAKASTKFENVPVYTPRK